MTGDVIGAVIPIERVCRTSGRERLNFHASSGCGAACPRAARCKFKHVMPSLRGTLAGVQIRHEPWQQPATRVAAAGGQKFRLAPPVRNGLIQNNVELIERPLRGADGTVADEIADADILISGGTTVDDATLGQLRNVRFLLRPYVGYDDIDVDAVTRHG